MIKLAGGAFRRLLEARPIYSSPKVSARRSCTIPRCPQLRSPHVHRERASQNPHATSMQNVGFNCFLSRCLQLSHLQMCAHVGSRVLELILMGDNDRSMLDFGAGATHWSVGDTLVRSTRGGCSAGCLPGAAVWRLWGA